MKDAGYLPVSNAADLAGIHITTLYELIKGGSVQGAKAGKRQYVLLRSLADHYASAPPIRQRILAAMP